jgi:hypothetical protein
VPAPSLSLPAPPPPPLCRRRRRLAASTAEACPAPPACPTSLQLAVFYVFIAIGFLALYLTWRSNAK